MFILWESPWILAPRRPTVPRRPWARQEVLKQRPRIALLQAHPRPARFRGGEGDTGPGAGAPPVAARYLSLSPRPPSRWARHPTTAPLS